MPRSEGSATREGSQASEPDLVDDQVASESPEIFSEQLISLNLIKDFKLEADEIIGISSENPDARRRIRLRRIPEHKGLEGDRRLGDEDSTTSSFPGRAAQRRRT